MADSGNHNNMRKLSFLGFGTDKNEDPDEVKLDAEMEKVFAGTDRNKERFHISMLHDSPDSKLSPPKYTEHSLDSRRTKPFSPRKSITSSMKRRDSSKDSTNISTDSAGTSQSSQTVATTKESSPITSPPPIQIKETEEEPLVSERAGHAEHHSDSSGDGRHVQFDQPTIGPTKIEHVDHPEDDSYDDDNDELRKRKGRHQHYKHRKYSLQDNSNNRRQNNNIDASSSNGSVRRISVQPEDAALEEADIDELISHRSDDPRGMRRHKIQLTDRVSRKESKDNTVSLSLTPKKHFDHSPHEVFVQLDELHGTGEDREWKETARWIKYEEDVEEASDRWGRPHVAPLSFHSLLNLRRCLETGVILMDLEEKDLPAVAYRVVEQMVIEELIDENDKSIIMRSLLLRHRHVNEHSHGTFHFGSRRKFSSYTSLQNLSADTKPKILPVSEINGHMGIYDTKIDMKEETYSTASQEDLRKVQNDTILKRIPVGAEATTVLVGAVDFLKQPTIAFVRLAEGISIPGVTEVPIPVRFIFILLGPKKVDLDYHEVGRSLATLMSNEIFNRCAYKADDRRDLLSAINEFLDDSIVLPPGNWQRDDLLPFEELKAKSEWIRSRKSKALKQKQREKQQLIADEEKRQLAAQIVEEKKPTGPLEKTHRLWGGVRNDIKRRFPMYKSDIKDGLNSETLAATIFMYFACLSTAITFGGIASEKTFNLIGISETLIASSFVGIIFHALAGQPLVIIGTTGPLLLFDEALYQFCLQNDLNFLTVRVYVGAWMALISLTVSAFEGSVYVRLFTRFTQELFSALITLIYIVETAMNIITVFQRHPLLRSYIYSSENLSTAPYAEALISTVDPNYINETQLTSAENTSMYLENSTQVAVSLNQYLQLSDSHGLINQPNTALFCSILTLGTFTIAYYLRIFRNSHFLGRSARRALGDFGVPIAIAIFVGLDFLIPQVYTDKLSVPNGISPSDPEKRGWLIPLDGVPSWIPFAAAVPALLVYILVFMETHISELIVDKPERGLKKGSGIHMDIVLLCILNSMCGLFGLPWHCAATVRSVTHVSAVTIMSRTHAPGDKPHITDVKEQRLSGLNVSLLIGLSVTMAPLLRLIPMSVLFGVFLYMGIASMSGVQFFDRLRLFFMPVKYHPAEPFVKKVPTWKMHAFTSIQIIALALLWAVKSSRFSLAFPFVLALMVPLRQRMAAFFTAREINALDGKQANVDPEDEPDFYEQTSIPA